MKVVKQRDYPVWVCYPCGDRHGFTTTAVPVSTQARATLEAKL